VSPGAGFRARLHDLYDAARHNRPDEVMQHLQRLVPEYRPAVAAVPAAAPRLQTALYPDDF
jgi:hypothetical protein